MGIIAEHIGKRIALLRGKMTQEQLAEVTGVNRVQLSRYERGKAVPSDENLKKLAAALSCDISDLLGFGRAGRELREKTDEFQNNMVTNLLDLLQKINAQRSVEQLELKKLHLENDELRERLLLLERGDDV